MLSCKDVVDQASNYLEHGQNCSDNAPATPFWRIRMHLLLCHHCRRFMRHLQATRTLVSQIARDEETHDAMAIMQQIKTQHPKP